MQPQLSARLLAGTVVLMVLSVYFSPPFPILVLTLTVMLAWLADPFDSCTL